MEKKKRWIKSYIKKQGYYKRPAWNRMLLQAYFFITILAPIIYGIFAYTGIPTISDFKDLQFSVLYGIFFLIAFVFLWMYHIRTFPSSAKGVVLAVAWFSISLLVLLYFNQSLLIALITHAAIDAAAISISAGLLYIYKTVEEIDSETERGNIMIIFWMVLLAPFAFLVVAIRSQLEVSDFTNSFSIVLALLIFSLIEYIPFVFSLQKKNTTTT